VSRVRRPLENSGRGVSGRVSGLSKLRSILPSMTCGSAAPFAERHCFPLEFLNFRLRISAVIVASGGERLRRPVLRKGSAFPGRASDFVLRLRLRLNRRGEASPKRQPCGSDGPERQSLSARQGGRAARDNQTNCGTSRRRLRLSKGRSLNNFFLARVTQRQTAAFYSKA